MIETSLTVYSGPLVSNEAIVNRQKEMDKFWELANNALTSRSQLYRQLMDPRRDIYDECGWKKGYIAVEDYQFLYNRFSYAGKVVDLYPKECWKLSPDIYETDDNERETEFERAWDALGGGLDLEEDEESYYREEQGNPIWEFLKRLDIQSGIGTYGVMLLGTDDGKDLREPLVKKKGTKLTYLRVFPETFGKITSFENDPTKKRYGKPLIYNIQFNGWLDNQGSGVGLEQSTKQVHWTRVIHFADNPQSSEIMGMPRMQQVLNELVDLQKVSGGAPEMFWKGAFPGVVLKTHPQLGGDVKVDLAGTRSMVEQYQNGLQKYLLLMGMDASSLTPNITAPTPFIEALIEAICTKMDCPVRVFKGSERGELASTQDDAAWDDRLKGRCNNVLTPRMLVPFINRLINLGILPVPKEGFKISWPDLTSTSAADRANVMLVRTQTLSAYVASGGDAILPPNEFLQRTFDMRPEEAEAMLEAAKEHQEEQQQQEMDQQRTMIDEGLAPDPTGGVDPNRGQPVSNWKEMVDNAKAKPAKGTSEGRWVTIEGRHVFVGKGGKLLSGPGGSPVDLGHLHDHPKAEIHPEGHNPTVSKSVPKAEETKKTADSKPKEEHSKQVEKDTPNPDKGKPKLPVGHLPQEEIGKSYSSNLTDVAMSKHMAYKYKCTQSQCYQNAAKVVAGETGYKYHEGIFSTLDGTDKIDHAWTTDPHGNIVDPSFHVHGVYHPLLTLDKSELKHYESNDNEHRKYTAMQRVGSAPDLGKLQGIVNPKTPKQLKKEFEAHPKIAQGGADFDYRGMNPKYKERPVPLGEQNK